MAVLHLPPWLSHDLLLLFGARAFRSLAQGFLGIILPLYLAALGYHATAMGLLFAVSSITGALMAAAVGFLADRFGRKPFLVIIALLMAGGSLVFAISQNFAVMVAAAALGTIGYAGAPGLGGGWGPYYPAAQSLVAEQGEAHQRTTIFGALSRRRDGGRAGLPAGDAAGRAPSNGRLDDGGRVSRFVSPYRSSGHSDGGNRAANPRSPSSS